MAHERAGDENREIISANDRPTLNVVLALIIVLIITLIFRVIMVLTDIFVPEWYYLGGLSLYVPVYYLLYGGLLLVLACLLITNKG